MNFTRFASARRAVLAMFAVFAAVLPQAAFAQADALAGTWNYVPARSNFNPGPARYKNLTLTVTPTGQMTIEGADAQGNPVKINYQNVQDGKPHPVSGMTQYDNSALTRINETMTSYIYSKGKTTVAVGSRVLSREIGRAHV